MKCSDYIAQELAKRVEYVFTLQGGAITHLIDSCARLGPKPIYCHHEQAAGFAASAYARVRGFGVCIVTTGPGGTNAMTPLLGAWQDSIPVLFISGQQRASQLSYGSKRRKTGTQEANILHAVEPWVVDSGLCTTPGETRLTFLRVIDWMLGGDGPGWLDICQDALWSEL